MNKLLKKYLIKNYSDTFFPIFLTLYTITSIIFLVKIASLTSVIQINFLELLELYSYSIPTILYYTLPISIFVSLSLALAKLSSEYELIVITSFGFNPRKVMGLVFSSLVLVAILMLTISFVLIPKADFLKKSFINDKKVEAQFNIKPSEYGQQFGEWFIYVKEEKKGLYKDLVLFQQTANAEDTFVIAEHGTMSNQKTSLNMSLQDGKVLRIKDGIDQVDFKKMVIYNEIEESKKINSFNDIIDYWTDIKENKNKEYFFTFYILVSIFPIISLFFIIFVGYFNPRYDKNYSTMLSVFFTILYVIVAQNLTDSFGVKALYFFPIVWFILGFIFYKIKIRPYY